MLVVQWCRQNRGPHVGRPLPPQQPVERPSENTVEIRGKGDGLESGQMPTHADL